MLETAVAEGFMKRVCLSLYGVFDDSETLLEYVEQYDASALEVHHLKNI